MKTVWVWTQDEIAPLPSGRRRVRVKDHPTRKGYVKVYAATGALGYPAVLGKASFEELVVDDPS